MADDPDIWGSAGASGWWRNFSAFGQQTPVAWSQSQVPVSLLMNSHHFCTYLPYLLGEAVSSREAVSSFLSHRLDSFSD